MNLFETFSIFVHFFQPFNIFRQCFSLNCWGEYSCSILSLDKVIDNIPDINSAEECQNICNDLDGCKYFTYYDETSNVGRIKNK